ncbi:tyrosine-protein phosphatase [Gulosibacter bifidus]|uniref:Tyrosine-protein phosphatase n=1 Tax=Gulosibacter bifidus TaxID=272239 RepID=A0ABW5RKD6_9MICO|nr:tyrosine-protein phosphatase [Gulosibacter bifidus]
MVDFESNGTAPGAPAAPDAHGTRRVLWHGFYNARDLGGLPLTGGGTTRFGGYVRSADLRFATPAGLRDMAQAGVGTVVDLRNDFETHPVPRSPEDEAANAHRVPPTREADLPEGVFGVRVPLDNPDRVEFWQRMRAEGRLGTPRFFAPVLREHPERVVAALRVIAAAPGGVLYHCAVGRDRTGLVTFALLALAGVRADAIASDYALSAGELAPFFARLDYPNQAANIDAILAEQGHTLESAVAEQLDAVDVAQVLRDAGLSDGEIRTLRARLVP